MPRHCSVEMIVLKLATGAQTVIQWLSSMVLKISTETVSCPDKCFHNHKDGGRKGDKIGIYFFYRDGKN